jgi:hypothetical protein
MFIVVDVSCGFYISDGLLIKGDLLIMRFMLIPSLFVILLEKLWASNQNELPEF